MFFMPGDAVLFNQVDKIARGVGGQRRAAKIRILRQKISRPRADIGEVAAPTPRDADFLGQALRMFHDDHTQPPLTCDGGGHHARRTPTDNGYIEIGHYSSLLQRSEERSVGKERVRTCSSRWSPKPS